jgi:TPR repeat protein
VSRKVAASWTPVIEASVVAFWAKAGEAGQRASHHQGLADVQHNLGVMYRDGRGVAQDDAQAIAWYRRAVERGFANDDAKEALRRMHEQGRDAATTAQ